MQKAKDGRTGKNFDAWLCFGTNCLMMQFFCHSVLVVSLAEWLTINHLLWCLAEKGNRGDKVMCARAVANKMPREWVQIECTEQMKIWFVTHTILLLSDMINDAENIYIFFCKDIRQRKKCSINLRLVRGSREICGEQSLYRRGREKTITERNSSFVYSNWQTGYRLLSVAVSSLFRNEIDPENNPEHEQSAAFLRDSLVKVRKTERREPAQHGTTVRQIKLTGRNTRRLFCLNSYWSHILLLHSVRVVICKTTWTLKSDFCSERFGPTSSVISADSLARN